MQTISNKNRIKKSSAGFTLLEIVVSLSILSMVTVGSLYATGNMVKLNKLSMLELAASSVIDSEMARMTSISANRTHQSYGGGTAKAFVYYLKHYSEYLKDEADASQYRFDRIGMRNGTDSSGVLIFEFPVPTPGYARISSLSLADAQRGDLIGVGCMEVYLDESEVPEEFFRWSRVEEGGIVTDPSAMLTFFDMNNDEANGGNFVNLYNPGNSSDYGGSGLRNLPIRLNVRYYNTFSALEADRSSSGVGFDFDNAVVTIQRDFLITDKYVGSTGALEELAD